MKPESCGESTITEYKVEVRDTIFSVHNPIILSDGEHGETIVGPDWQEVRFNKGFNPAGVPLHKATHLEDCKRDILGYESALALAWTILAQNYYRFGLEARIVAYELKTSWERTRKGVVDGGPIKLTMTSPKLESEPTNQ